AMMAQLRAEGKKAAILTAGYEAGKGMPGGSPVVPTNRIELWPGEVFATSSSILPHMDCLPLIEAGPFGSSALGPVVIARAGRYGNAILVGPGQNETLAEASRDALALPGIDAVIIDGTLSRLTQLSHLQEALLFCAVMVDRANCRRIAERMVHFLRLATLPEWKGRSESGLNSGTCHIIDGPLTSSKLAELSVKRAAAPGGERTLPIVVDDMAHIFLSEQELESLVIHQRLFVARPTRFAGFVLTLRDLLLEEFLPNLPANVVDHIICSNPYEEDAYGMGGAA
ncbi:MAG: hypothetical protein N3A02_00785, partial [Rectinema sp.]|nr:hypothetical protein [Rectinema sp.]